MRLVRLPIPNDAFKAKESVFINPDEVVKVSQYKGNVNVYLTTSEVVSTSAPMQEVVNELMTNISIEDDDHFDFGYVYDEQEHKLYNEEWLEFTDMGAKDWYVCGDNIGLNGDGKIHHGLTEDLKLVMTEKLYLAIRPKTQDCKPESFIPFLKRLDNEYYIIEDLKQAGTGFLFSFSISSSVLGKLKTYDSIYITSSDYLYNKILSVADYNFINRENLENQIIDLSKATYEKMRKIYGIQQLRNW